MTQEAIPKAYDLDAHGFSLPTPDEGLVEAKRRIAQVLRATELVWLVGERYDQLTPAWIIDIVRQGARGQWVRQRSKFDIQAEVLYYMGEQPLTDAEFRQVRRNAQVFQVAEWQSQ